MADDGLDGLEDGELLHLQVKKVEWAVHCLDY